MKKARGHQARDRVVIFPSKQRIVVISPSDDTVETLERIADRIEQYDDAHLFAVAPQTFDDRAFSSEASLRSALEDVLSEYDRFREQIVEWWWQQAGVVFHDDTDSGDTVVETVDSETHEEVVDAIGDFIQERCSPTRSIVESDSLLEAVSAVQRITRVSDYRSVHDHWQDLMEPVMENRVDELPNRVQIIGIDDSDSVHCYQWATRVIYVVDSEQETVEITHPLTENERVEKWMKFVDKEEIDRDWVYTAVSW